MSGGVVVVVGCSGGGGCGGVPGNCCCCCCCCLACAFLCRRLLTSSASEPELTRICLRPLGVERPLKRPLLGVSRPPPVPSSPIAAVGRLKAEVEEAEGRREEEGTSVVALG